MFQILTVLSSEIVKALSSKLLHYTYLTADLWPPKSIALPKLLKVLFFSNLISKTFTSAYQVPINKNL